MKRALAVTILIVSTMTACAAHSYTCTDPLGCLEIPSGNPVVIGIIYTSEGPEARVGSDVLERVEELIDKKGTLLGHEINLIREGSDCSPEGAATAAIRLALTSDTLVVIGPTCTADITLTDTILRDAGLSTFGLYLPDIRNEVEQLFATLEQTAVRVRGAKLYYPRTVLREALAGIGIHP